MKTQRRRPWLWLWLAGALLHLSLVALGAAKFDLEKWGRVGQALDYYGSLSGAGSAYGFFSPGIHSQLGVSFKVTDDLGNKKILDFETGLNHETDLRLGNILSQFENESILDKSALHRSLAASLAAAILARNTDAKEIEVRLEQFLPVSMEDFRLGLRPKWSSLYEAKFIYAAR